MADDFAYLNARVRVRRGTLLKESFFQEALDLSFADFLRLLSETVYGGELAGQGLPDVDRAVLRTQAKLVGDLPRLVTGEAREAVRLLLLRNDLHNLQALLRAKASVDAVVANLNDDESTGARIVASALAAPATLIADLRTVDAEMRVRAPSADWALYYAEWFLARHSCHARS